MRQFKVNDWVSINGSLKQITSLSYDYNGEINAIFCGQAHYSTQRDIKLWQPKEDEYCWNNAKRTIVHIRNIVKDQYGVSFGCYSVTNGTSSAGYYKLEDLEPFIGTLPSFLQ